MKRLTELLHSPYPALCQRWKTVLIPSVIIFLIIYLLQPFGIAQIHNAHKFLILLGYGMVTGMALGVFVYVLPALFPNYYNEQRWTLGKQLLNILMNCVLIAVGNWLYTSWLYGLEPSWYLLLVCILWVAILAPFPTTIFLMWNRNLLLARNLKEATEMNFYLSKKIVSKDKNPTEKEEEEYLKVLTFSGGTKEVLEVNADNFLYAEAEGNYVKLACYSVKDKKVVQKLLRVTMKQAEETIANYSYIIRCHRAFLVNVRKVVKVEGNSQGYRLRLEGCEEEVPVSRAYAKEMKTLIENEVGS